MKNNLLIILFFLIEILIVWLLVASTKGGK